MAAPPSALASASMATGGVRAGVGSLGAAAGVLLAVATHTGYVHLYHMSRMHASLVATTVRTDNVISALTFAAVPAALAPGVSAPESAAPVAAASAASRARVGVAARPVASAGTAAHAASARSASAAAAADHHLRTLLFATTRSGGVLAIDAATGSSVHALSGALQRAVANAWRASARYSSVGGSAAAPLTAAPASSGSGGGSSSNAPSASAVAKQSATGCVWYDLPAYMLVMPIAATSGEGGGDVAALKFMVYGTHHGITVTVCAPSSAAAATGTPAPDADKVDTASVDVQVVAHPTKYANLLAAGTLCVDAAAAARRPELAVVELPWRTVTRHLTQALARKRYGA
ncbi:hypothetical protein EON68_04040 [archaeon]|nr:MAG: hypothetical protein EON68_04040 [archaeon]